MKMILAGLWGGAFGFAILKFIHNSDWAMVSFTVGIFIAIFYLVIWMIDLRYRR